MDVWHHIDKGSGPPLVLLHAFGLSSRSWAPVIDMLAVDRRVIAFDVPGFGETPMPADYDISAAYVASKVPEQLAMLGVEGPVDYVGNSMGGWIALEAAKQGLAHSVVGLCPAGLWDPVMPGSTYVHLYAIAVMSSRFHRRAGDLRAAAVRRAVMRFAVGSPRAIPKQVALDAADDFAKSPVIRVVLRAGRLQRFAGGRGIDVPLTIAFGELDNVLLARNARRRDELPTHTRWVELPRCGHCPQWDDPELVARTILNGAGEEQRMTA